MGERFGAVSRPPSTNRGAEIRRDRLRVAVDWFEPSLTGVDVETVERVLLSYVGGEFVEMPHGARGYAHLRRGPAGCQVMYDDRRPEIHVVLPGEWCAALDEASMRGLLAWSRSRVCNVSRLDLAGDDWRKLVRPADVDAAIDGNQLVTHTRARQFVKNQALGGGNTQSFGKRGSRQFLRIYDKDLQSGGEVDAVRWELETRDEAAVALLKLLPTVKGWGQIWADAVSSFVDFRERWAAMNVTECPRVGWYDELIGSAEKWSPYDAKAPRTVGEVFNWLVRYMGPSMALMLRAAHGDVGVLTEIADAGRDRLSRSQRLMLAAYLAGEEAA